jgi:hypothetical protein
MQKLSGVITEGEYNQKIEELNSAESTTETLNENVVGVGGTMNPYPAKKKEVYESAFNKFLGINEDEDVEEHMSDPDMRHKDDKGPDRGAERKSLDSEPRYNPEDLDEDERTDTEEEGYKDGFKDAVKDAEEAIKKLRKELKEEEDVEEGITEDARTDTEEEGYQDGFRDAIKDALEALKGIKGELTEEDGEELNEEEDIDVLVKKAEQEGKSVSETQVDESIAATGIGLIALGKLFAPVTLAKVGSILAMKSVIPAASMKFLVAWVLEVTTAGLATGWATKKLVQLAMKLPGVKSSVEQKQKEIEAKKA